MSPKNFLFVSYDALITDIAWQVARQGHAVKYCIDTPYAREIGDGFVAKTDDWRQEVDWADVIVFDDVLGHGKLAHELRQQGKYVVGGTPYTDQLEDDRSFGQEELKRHKVAIIPYRDFTSFDEAIAYVKANPARYVIKPSGEAQNIKSLLFVGEEEDGQDVVRVLGDYQRAWADQIPVFQLQKRVTGVEVAVGAFFNGKKFIEPININFEHKKLFPGNLGPSTGEMGTTFLWSGPNKLFNATLKKFESRLAEEGYVGYIDINCIVNGNGIYPLEWTTRFGYPLISIQEDSMITPIGEFFYDIASGRDVKLKVKSGFHIGVRLVVPPFPYKDKKNFDAMSKDAVVVFKKVTEGVHLEDIKLQNGEWMVTGAAGVALIVCGNGATMAQAQKQVYARIKNILIPHMYYRTDIGDRWLEDSDRLMSWGFLREM